MFLWLNLFWFTAQSLIILIIAIYDNTAEFPSAKIFCFVNFVIYIICSIITLFDVISKENYVLTFNINYKSHSFVFRYNPVIGFLLLVLALWSMTIETNKIVDSNMYTLFRILSWYNIIYSITTLVIIVSLYLCDNNDNSDLTFNIVNGTRKDYVAIPDQRFLVGGYKELDSFTDGSTTEV